jgi:hypothetical protein
MRAKLRLPAADRTGAQLDFIRLAKVLVIAQVGGAHVDRWKRIAAATMAMAAAAIINLP